MWDTMQGALKVPKCLGESSEIVDIVHTLMEIHKSHPILFSPVNSLELFQHLKYDFKY